MSKILAKGNYKQVSLEYNNGQLTSIDKIELTDINNITKGEILLKNDKYTKYKIVGTLEGVLTQTINVVQDDIDNNDPDNIPVTETYTDYINKTKPNINKFDRVWVDNIFEGKA